jgi:hypothetical protein
MPWRAATKGLVRADPAPLSFAPPPSYRRLPDLAHRSSHPADELEDRRKHSSITGNSFFAGPRIPFVLPKRGNGLVQGYPVRIRG